MREALNKVKEDLGEDAVILRTRTLKRAWGLLGRVFEVTAALEDDKLPPLGLPAPYSSGFHKSARLDGPELLERLRTLEGLVVGIDRTLRAQIKELPEELLPVYEHLLRHGVEEDIARSLVQEGGTPEAIREMVEKLICTKEPIKLNPPHRKVVALVGPTGVGKSTTAAKIACLAKQDGARVALIGTDSKRIGAALQLRAIAESLDIPYRLVFSGKDMEEATSNFEDVDLLLIDCAGASQYEDMALWHLKSLLEAASFLIHTLDGTYYNKA